MRSELRAFKTAVAIFVGWLVCGPAQAADGPAQVTKALDQVESWVGSGPNGQAWNAYLGLPKLRAQLAKGDQADPAEIEAVLKQLQSGAPGLERPQFATLRDSVADWSANLSIAKAPSLSDAALGAKERFVPITAETVKQDKQALADAVAALDKYLTPGGENGVNWKKYLKFEDLTEQLKSDSPNPEALQRVLRRFKADKIGLEMPVYFRVTKAIEQYANALTATSGDLRAQAGEQLTSLADELKNLGDTPTDEAANAVGARLGWLTNMRQNAPLVQAIRQRISHPNLVVKISDKIVGAGIEQPVDEVAPVVDNILGTSIYGTGRTRGRIELRVLPDANRAVLETLLTGTVQAQTVGYNGPATIYTNSNTQIRGSKRIVLNELGLASYPATASANTSTQITGIGARSGLVQKIATKKAYQMKSQAEQIGSGHAADRVRQRVEKQAADQLNQAQGQYIYNFRNPLLRVQEFPSLLKFQTTGDALLLTALQANRYQLGAPTLAPAIDVKNDMSMEIHESLVNNFCSSLLSGMTLKEADLQKKVIELRGSLPEQLKSEEDRDPWSITFAKVRPVTVKFGDNNIVITVRGQRYTSGDREFQAMNVTADYKVETSGNGARFVRNGDLQIMPPSFVPGRRLSAQQVTLKTLLQRKFGRMFEPEIKTEGLVLPGRWAEAGRLDLKQLRSGTGWLVFAWVASGEPAPPQPPKTASVAQR